MKSRTRNPENNSESHVGLKPQSLALSLNALITKQLDKILSQVKPEFNLVCFTIITFLLPPVYVHRRQVNSGLS